MVGQGVRNIMYRGILRRSVLAAFACAGLAAPTALADTPAVTDFGASSADTVQSVWQETQPDSRYAIFLTLYQDGRRQVDIRPISGDEVVSFRTEHPAWELSPTLMWFWAMPVYVRQVSSAAEAETV